MFEERLPTGVWVDALIRRAQIEGASGFVLQQGDASRGDVVIKISDMRGNARAYVPRTNMEGERVFVDLRTQNIGPDETSVDTYVRKAMARDRDTWAIEIEDRDMRHFLTEPVEAPADTPSETDAGSSDANDKAETNISPNDLFPRLR